MHTKRRLCVGTYMNCIVAFFIPVNWLSPVVSYRIKTVISYRIKTMKYRRRKQSIQTFTLIISGSIKSLQSKSDDSCILEELHYSYYLVKDH